MNKKPYTPNIINNVFGVASILGFLTGVVLLIFSIIKGDVLGQFEVILTLAIVVLGLLGVFILFTRFYFKELKLMNDLPYVAQEANRISNETFVHKKNMAESFHFISHYTRNITAYLYQIKNEELDNEQVKLIKEKFHTYLINLTTSLKQYYTLASGSVCSVTIKIINNEEDLIKTFFRDPLSLKRRRSIDSFYTNNSGSYPSYSNTAFSVILDDSYSNVNFAHDDLYSLFLKREYENCNLDWYYYYNATIVVPISIITGDNERNIIGFITIDNMNGKLNDEDKIEYLMAVGDTFYNALDKYQEIITFAKDNNLLN